MNEEKCWAASLEGCGGQISKEHIVTEGLFEKGVPVRVEGLGGWLGAQTVQKSIRKLTANILCEDHNEELGRTADFEAIRLLRQFRAIRRPMELPGSRILRPPVGRRVSGVNFGRWLCKTHCNLMVLNGMTPDSAYIAYAMLRPIPKPIHFFFASGVGENLRLGDSRDAVVSWSQFIVDDEPSIDAFLISVAGFTTVVSTTPVQRNANEMIDRIKMLQQPTPLGFSRIVFDWSGEPAVVPGPA